MTFPILLASTAILYFLPRRKSKKFNPLPGKFLSDCLFD
jgi:hypothetical protein